jgi:hypothetical protein
VLCPDDSVSLLDCHRSIAAPTNELPRQSDALQMMLIFPFDGNLHTVLSGYNADIGPLIELGINRRTLRAEGHAVIQHENLSGTIGKEPRQRAYGIGREIARDPHKHESLVVHKSLEKRDLLRRRLQPASARSGQDGS